MNKPVLVVMAAGMGSRYGGMKQIDPVGPCGQVIVDYSLYDARRAGFETVIFVIKHEIEEAFKAAIGDRVSRVCLLYTSAKPACMKSTRNAPTSVQQVLTELNMTQIPPQ